MQRPRVSYGVDPIPTTAANAILTDLPEVDVVMKKLDRLNVKAFFGNRPAINIGEAIKISFSTEVKGSGDSLRTRLRRSASCSSGAGCWKP